MKFFFSLVSNRKRRFSKPYGVFCVHQFLVEENVLSMFLVPLFAADWSSLLFTPSDVGYVAGICQEQSTASCMWRWSL
jgi:hypothetical protein